MKQQNLISSYIFVAIILFTFAVSNHTKIENRIEYFKNKKEKLAQQEINGVDIKLVEAIIHVESSGNPLAVSKDNCIGLMQLNPAYWVKGCGLKHQSELFDPEININCGVKVLNHYLDIEKGNIRKALQRYHGGYSIGKKSIAYADKVLAVYQNLV